MFIFLLPGLVTILTGTTTTIHHNAVITPSQPPPLTVHGSRVEHWFFFSFLRHTPGYDYFYFRFRFVISSFYSFFFFCLRCDERKSYFPFVTVITDRLSYGTPLEIFFDTPSRDSLGLFFFPLSPSLTPTDQSQYFIFTHAITSTHRIGVFYH